MLTKEYTNKKNNKIKNIPRILTINDNNDIKKEESLFYQVCFGEEINLKHKYDSGIINNFMKSFLNLNFDEEENELVSINQYTNINKDIKKFISIPKGGNYLVFQLYKKLTNQLESLTQQIIINISNLNNLIEYKNLTEIFEFSSNLYNL